MKSLKLKNLLVLFFLLAVPIVASADEVIVDASLANPYLKSGVKQKTYLKVGLTGFKIKDKKERTPVNVSIVLDRSSSMYGSKIFRAKQAAKMAIDRLHREDIVSIVTYSSTVSVIVPATKVRDKEMIHAAIDRVHSSGSTALFAGVSKGAAEIRKFLDSNRVNRVILLSDGLANVGPSSPGALGNLGAALSKEGISVTTIGLGLGYNEDLMAQLAKRSDGNHAFVEHPSDLAKIFNLEFGDILSVVAQDVEIYIDCGRGVNPLRVLGRESSIYGKRVKVKMNQLYSNQEKYILLEIEPPVSNNLSKKNIANVNISYKNMVTKRRNKLDRKVKALYTNSNAMYKRSVNDKVMVAAVMLIATEENKRAVLLRDKGKVKEAQAVLQSNVDLLNKTGKKYNSSALKKYSKDNYKDMNNLDESNWRSRRKQMRKMQNTNEMQQSY